VGAAWELPRAWPVVRLLASASERRHRDKATRLTAAVLTVALAVPCSTLHANKYGSVEPIANSAVIDTALLSAQPLKVREAFANRLLQCGIVNQVVEALSKTRAITTINGLNTSVAVGAGGFMGRDGD
jgi:hypothetical protein